MAREIEIDGITVVFGAGDKRTVTIIKGNGAEGKVEVEIPELVFLKISELQITGRDLLGRKSDGVDPNYQFVGLMCDLELGDGFATGTQRFKAPPYCTMFQGHSRPPVPR